MFSDSASMWGTMCAATLLPALIAPPRGLWGEEWEEGGERGGDGGGGEGPKWGVMDVH